MHNLICPIDGAHLEVHEKQLSCENGHSFDIARQGYVNLLPVQHKRSKDPGDSKAMVVARTQFLNSGVYQSIASKLAEIILAQTVNSKEALINSSYRRRPVSMALDTLDTGLRRYDDEKNNQSFPESICLMDAGCGEGYYTHYVYECLKDKGVYSGLSFIGLDISKPAIVEAAKRNRQITWVVGTNRHPPLEPASVDIIVCVFGFQNFEGFNKVLKPGGRIILVEPGPDHLQELREIIYAEVKKTGLPSLSEAEEKGFVMLADERLQFKTETLDNAQINNLLLMTPHFYRAGHEGREAAGKLETLNLTVDIVFRTLEWRKTNYPGHP